ncbi:hypothetical protein D9M68_867750 [compost metagenome]
MPSPFCTVNPISASVRSRSVRAIFSGILVFTRASCRAVFSLATMALRSSGCGSLSLMGPPIHCTSLFTDHVLTGSRSGGLDVSSFLR